MTPAKEVRRALKRGAFLICPDCDDGMCFRCSRANEAVRLLVENAESKKPEVLPTPHHQPRSESNADD